MTAIKAEERGMSSTAATLDALINRVGNTDISFSIELPNGETRVIGRGKPEFHVNLRNERALRALHTLDEAEIAEAYLHGDIDLDGDMLKPFTLRARAPISLALSRARLRR
jgi:cyclopropane-fatty-acyl-phospholipid synthase